MHAARNKKRRRVDRVTPTTRSAEASSVWSWKQPTGRSPLGAACWRRRRIGWRRVEVLVQVQYAATRVGEDLTMHVERHLLQHLHLPRHVRDFFGHRDDVARPDRMRQHFRVEIVLDANPRWQARQ